MLHTDAGFSKTCPGTGTEIEKWATLMVQNIVIHSITTGRTVRSESKTDGIISYVSWTLPQTCLHSFTKSVL